MTQIPKLEFRILQSCTDYESMAHNTFPFPSLSFFYPASKSFVSMCIYSPPYAYMQDSETTLVSSTIKNSLNAQQVTINGIGVAHFCVICLGATCCTWILSPSLLHLLPGCYHYSHHQPKKKKKSICPSRSYCITICLYICKSCEFLEDRADGCINVRILQHQFCLTQCLVSISWEYMNE